MVRNSQKKIGAFVSCVHIFLLRHLTKRIVQEASLQSIQLLRKIPTIRIIANTATGKPHCASTPCVVSEKHWNTREDKGKSMMCVLYVLRLAKRHVLGRLGLSDIIVLAIYHDILKVLISQYFVINYCDTMPVHYCH